jgi:hypothetical protein
VITILGSGFGLYGYLPALVVECSQRILLPERYRSRFCERPELARFSKNVQWERDEATALDRSDGAVLALRPVDHMEWIPQCLARNNIKGLVLEKPLAISPEAATMLFGHLIRSRKAIRMGYTFRYTEWGKWILEAMITSKESKSLSIHWSFLAHHFRYDLRNWKRYNSSGGGAIRFYGIQLIALLAEIGYRDVILSQSFGISLDEIEKWTASFTGPALPVCDIVVDTRTAVGQFYVKLLSNSGNEQNTVVVNLTDPFDSIGEESQWRGFDRRVPILSHLCRSLWDQSINEYAWYEATIKLWCRIEEKTRFEMKV